MFEIECDVEKATKGRTSTNRKPSHLKNFTFTFDIKTKRLFFEAAL